MECPACKYFHGWDGEIMDIREGNKGEFFKLSVEMERKRAWKVPEQKELYGCPNCGNIFIEI